MTETPPPINALETSPSATAPAEQTPATSPFALIKNKIRQSTVRLRHLDHIYYLIPLLTLIFFLAALFAVKYLPLPLFSAGTPLSPMASSSAMLNNESEKVAGIATESAALVESIITEGSTPAPEEPTENTPTPTGTLSVPTATLSVAPTTKTVSVTSNRGRIDFPNNKFGIYIEPGIEQVSLASELVNSNNGNWGWILMPMEIGERNAEKWNGIFAKAREKHLIPIIQISKANINSQVPTEGEIDGIAEFLAGLGWPTKIRAVSLFNEVNASEYWGGKVDPEGYARVLNHAIDKFHSLSIEFFVMNGAFNSSAHDTCTNTDIGGQSCYMSLDTYMSRMNQAVKNIFSRLDGWANHSYPLPGYGGKPLDGDDAYHDYGRLTIHAYRYDLRLLAKYGVSLPVFITETGWPHAEGTSSCPSTITCYDQQTVADYYSTAFSKVWSDPAVVAVTPFQLNRSDGLHGNFAFVAADGSKFPQWNAIVSIPKISGAPPVN